MKEPKSLDERLDRLLSATREIRTRLAQLESQVALLVRNRVLEDPSDRLEALDRARFSYFSQHEEDGVLLALFREIGTTNRQFVEIGCGSNGGNSGFLARECGWSGLMLDAAERAVRATRRLFDRERVDVVQAQVESGTVLGLLAAHGVPRAFDLLSLDIDSTDYWVLKAVTEAHRPRVIIVEYNSAFGPDAAVTVPDAPVPPASGGGHERYYRGASLRAFCHLLKPLGYRLLLTDPTGTNALFVLGEAAPALVEADPARAFRLYLGHEAVVEEVGDLVGYFERRGLKLVYVGA